MTKNTVTQQDHDNHIAQEWHNYIVENVKDWEGDEPIFYNDIFEPRPRWDYDDYDN